MPEEALLTAPTCQDLRGKQQAPGKCHSTPGTVPTDARVRQQPNTQLSILTEPETLAGLWLLCAYQQTGASQPSNNVRQSSLASATDTPTMRTLVVPG